MAPNRQGQAHTFVKGLAALLAFTSLALPAAAAAPPQAPAPPLRPPPSPPPPPPLTDVCGCNALLDGASTADELCTKMVSTRLTHCKPAYAGECPSDFTLCSVATESSNCQDQKGEEKCIKKKRKGKCAKRKIATKKCKKTCGSC